MFLRDVFTLYKEYKKNHKDEIMRHKLEKRLARTPFSYALIEQFLEAAFKERGKGLVFEAKTMDGTVIKIYYDQDSGSFKRRTTTESIMLGV